MKKHLKTSLVSLLPMLLIFSVPWYRKSGARSSFLIDGIPDWVTVALICYALIALVNFVVWVFCYQSDH